MSALSKATAGRAEDAAEKPAVRTPSPKGVRGALAQKRGWKERARAVRTFRARSAIR
jgi:hypothetical protein